MSIVRLAIDRLRNFGDDPAPPTRVNHYLLFSDQPSADAAALRLRQRRFDVEVTRADDGCCTILAGHSVIPSRAAMEQVTEYLEDLAAECGGEYDGWTFP